MGFQSHAGFDPLVSLPTNLNLEETEVHLWHISLMLEPGKVGRLFEILGEDERRKTARFHFRKDQERFVIARGSLRLLLASYLREAPDKIRFRYGPQGKPELEMGEIEPQLHFNLSHSHEVGFCAVAHGRQVGADVEKIKSEALDGIGIAEQYFTPFEAGLIRSASVEMRTDVFFRLWTRKEAFLKANGEGLSESLNKFEVSLDDSKIRFLDQSEDELQNWSVHEFRPCFGYVGAVAIEGGFPQFKFLTTECRGNEIIAKSISTFPATG